VFSPSRRRRRQPTRLSALVLALYDRLKARLRRRARHGQAGEQRRPEAGRRPKLRDSPMHPTDTVTVSQISRCGARTRSGPCKSAPVTGRRKVSNAWGVPTAVAPPPAPATEILDTADTPRRSRLCAAGFERLPNCSARTGERDGLIVDRAGGIIVVGKKPKGFQNPHRTRALAQWAGYRSRMRFTTISTRKCRAT